MIKPNQEEAQAKIDLGYSFTVWDSGDKSNKTIYLDNQEHFPSLQLHYFHKVGKIKL